MARRTPFHAQHAALGARFVDFAGWEMPVQYTGLIEEHTRVREAAGLFDVSHMGEIHASGPRVVEALEWLLSNDVAGLAVGQARYNVMCNHEGTVVDDVVLYRRGAEDFLICVNAANRDKDFAWITLANPFPDGATFEDHGDDWAQVAIQGPEAPAILQRLTGLDLSAIGTYHFAEGTVAGIEGCIVARTGYTGEDGFEVFAPADRAEPLWGALLSAGEPEGILPIGLGARDTLRLEARYCLYGHELDDAHTPLQARLGWVTRLDKAGGFLGADAIRARKATDDSFLAGLILEGGRVAREGMAVLADGEVVGVVTSGTRSPTLGRSICLAWVRSPWWRPGSRLVIDVRGREAVGEVVKGPFYKRDDRRDAPTEA